ncbi:hypothetical protein [Sorangium sp. So ce854]|uniref:hypothetical protein n=1 Tax=Sorangium sp. So ce854 TaxID=3133322 RepID=UPI003F5E2C3D
MSRSRDRQELGTRPLRRTPGALRGARCPARAAVAAVMGLLGAAEAHAAPEPPAVRLELRRGPGAEGCPDETYLGSEVALRLGVDPFEDDAPRALTVHIAREGPELTASLALRDSEGKTQWAGGFSTRSGCEELLSGVALAIVAQLLGAPEPAGLPSESSPPSGSSPPLEPTPPSGSSAPSGSLPPSGSSAPPPAVQRAAPEPPRPTGAAGAPPRPAPPQAGPERLRLEAGLGASVGLGITPGVATGMTLSLGVRRSDWSIAVEGRGLVSMDTVVAGTPLGTTAVSAATLACYRGGLLFGCGLATLGAVRFTPRDPWTMRPRSDAVFGFGARLGAELPLSLRWSAQGYAEAAWIVNEAALLRAAHGSATPAPLRWTSSPLGAVFGLGVTATY